MTLEQAIVDDFGERVKNAKRFIKQYLLALKNLMHSNVYFEILTPESIRVNQNTPVLYLLDIPFAVDGPEERIGSGHYSFYSPPETVLRLPYRPEKAMSWSVGVLLYKLVSNRYPFSSNT